MDISPEIPGNKYYIDRYGDGGFSISGKPYKGSIIVSPDKLFEWPMLNVEFIGANDIQLILSKLPSIEILLIGSGQHLSVVSSEVINISQARGVNLDIMETGAAWRTYNGMMSEGRLVGGALIAI